MKTIIFFSNPFGYGPTTTLIHIAESLNKRVNGNIKMVVAGKENGLCKEIFNKSNHSYIKWHDLDERNYEEVKSFLSSFKSPFVVSVLNRFSIKAAHELKLPNILIDFLAWFWDKPSFEYSLADMYLYNSLGKDLSIPNKISYDIPIILGSIPKRIISKKRMILINIGGSKNPLVEGIPIKYLTLLTKIINKLNFASATVYIAGGKEATEFIKKNLDFPDRFIVGSFSHEKFLKLHAACHHFITLSGTNATFMSFSLGIPTTFLLPQLLAHWKLSFILKKETNVDPLMWEDYFDINKKMYSLTEYDVVPYTEKLSQKVINNNKIFSKILTKIQDRLDSKINTSDQTKYIEKLGVNGEDVVSDLIIKKWRL
ncbi:hypothetical protein GYA19_00570 [Candidatus Beckwithbacteria bacterium]|nr:hypothetical protein [Candidatus Beckwithbacteria bacterium]